MRWTSCGDFIACEAAVQLFTFTRVGHGAVFYTGGERYAAGTNRSPLYTTKNTMNRHIYAGGVRIFQSHDTRDTRMQELLSKHMIGTFALEIAVLTVALSLIGFIGMRLRAKKTGPVHGVRQYLMTASFRAVPILNSFTDANTRSVAQIASRTLSCTYPRFYVGWSWQQPGPDRGMGLRTASQPPYMRQLFFNIAMFIPWPLHRGLPALGYAPRLWWLRAVDLH